MIYMVEMKFCPMLQKYFPSKIRVMCTENTRHHGNKRVSFLDLAWKIGSETLTFSEKNIKVLKSCSPVYYVLCLSVPIFSNFLAGSFEFTFICFYIKNTVKCYKETTQIMKNKEYEE